VRSDLRATGSSRWVRRKNLVNSSVPESTLLAGLGDETVQTLVAAAQVRRLGPNVMLIAEGQPANHLFLIKTGNARFYRVTGTGEDITLLWLALGDIVGLASLLAEHTTYLANAETMSPCELIVWDRARIRSFAAVHPKILENGVGVSLGYLKNNLERHADLATGSPEIRVARSLLHLADKIGRVHGAGIEIEVNNEHLGSLSDVSRFTASRVLAGWARSGKVSKQRGRVILHAPDALIQ
jgi:CRP-like cAMP-binding protein